MAAGFKYNLSQKEVKEERYDVQTGIRRRGAFCLDTTNLATGTSIPAFAPLYCDLVNKHAYLVCNISVYADASSATEIKVKKGTVAYIGEKISDGTNTAAVTAIDTSNSDYDVLTVDTALTLIAGDVLFEYDSNASTPKYTANSALYGHWKVTAGDNLVTALRRAAEIEPDKLVIPFSTVDRKALGERFEFNDNE